MDARTGEFYFLKKDRKTLPRKEMLYKQYPDKQPLYGTVELVYDGTQHPARGAFADAERERLDGNRNQML